MPKEFIENLKVHFKMVGKIIYQVRQHRQGARQLKPSSQVLVAKFLQLDIRMAQKWHLLQLALVDKVFQMNRICYPKDSCSLHSLMHKNLIY